MGKRNIKDSHHLWRAINGSEKMLEDSSSSHGIYARRIIYVNGKPVYGFHKGVKVIYKGKRGVVEKAYNFIARVRLEDNSIVRAKMDKLEFAEED